MFCVMDLHALVPTYNIITIVVGDLFAKCIFISCYNIIISTVPGHRVEAQKAPRTRGEK